MKFKNIFIAFLAIFLAVFVCQTLVFAQCEIEPTIAANGKILKELKTKKIAPNKINNLLEAELILSVKASIVGASWQKTNAEAAVLTVFVDDKYNQDIILFAGEKPFEYQMLLGISNRDEHKIVVTLNEAHSAANARNVKIQSVFYSARQNPAANLKTAKSSVWSHIAEINAPVIYLRPNTIDKFSDIPLLTYYEILDEPENVKTIRYTTIFTNEDGGTQSAALMARWGRMTDIEWIYEIRVKETGEILSEIYQAAFHQTKNFGGKRLGLHPLILDATVNNNFADAGCSALRVSPILIAAKLSNASRETVMDANAWTYQIMAQEAIREGRVNPEKLGANTIDDLRNYLFVEARSESDKTTVSLELTDNKAQQSASDFGDERLRVDRPGYFRIAVWLPNAASKPASIALQCHDALKLSGGTCQNASVLKILRLDQDFIPRQIAFETRPAADLKQGENIIYKIEN